MNLKQSIDLQAMQIHLHRFPAQLYPERLKLLPDLSHCIKAVLWDFWQAQWQTTPEPLELIKWVTYYSQNTDLTSGLILSCWTLASLELKPHATASDLARLLSSDLPELLNTVTSHQILLHPKRREEWLRWWCRELKIPIINESADQSQRRWLRLSSLKRAQVFQNLRQQRRRKNAILRAQSRLKMDLD